MQLSHCWRLGAALVLATTLLQSREVLAQASDSARADSLRADSALAWQLGYRRDRRTAVVLGALVPGAGHLYAGEWLRSYLNFVAAAGGIYVGPVVYNFDRCTFDWRPQCRSGVPLGARIAGAAYIAGGVTVWITGAIDAGRAVTRQRARRARAERQRRQSMWPVFGPCPLAKRSWCTGVAVAGAGE